MTSKQCATCAVVKPADAYYTGKKDCKFCVTDNKKRTRAQEMFLKSPLALTVNQLQYLSEANQAAVKTLQAGHKAQMAALRSEFKKVARLHLLECQAKYGDEFTKDNALAFLKEDTDLQDDLEQVAGAMVSTWKADAKARDKYQAGGVSDKRMEQRRRAEKKRVDGVKRARAAVKNGNEPEEQYAKRLKQIEGYEAKARGKAALGAD